MVCHQGVWANDRQGHAEPNSRCSLVFSIIEAPAEFETVSRLCSCELCKHAGLMQQFGQNSLLIVVMQDPPLEIQSEGK